MKSKMMKLFVMGMALASFCLMGCEPSKNGEGDNTVKDADGSVYPTVKIGNQVWMAKNLNVKIDGSRCYGDDPANCEKYGRLYPWLAAKMACPAGWHLPSKGEFDSFLEAIKLRLTQIETQKKLNAEPLRTNETSVFQNLRSTEWGGYDTFGFSALPAGFYHSGDKKFRNLGYAAHFWSSTEDYSGSAYILLIYGGDAVVGRDGKNLGSSVRCLQD